MGIFGLTYVTIVSYESSCKCTFKIRSNFALCTNSCLVRMKPVSFLPITIFTVTVSIPTKRRSTVLCFVDCFIWVLLRKVSFLYLVNHKKSCCKLLRKLRIFRNSRYLNTVKNILTINVPGVDMGQDEVVLRGDYP